MNRAEQAVRSLDRLQRRVPALAFLLAVQKKFGDDQAGNLAALVAYYSFASMFPLLLVFVTVAGLVLRHMPSLQQRLLSAAFRNFPVLGKQLQASIHSLHTTGIALAVGLVLTFLGARGVANSAQNALNTVWNVPYSRRPGFPWNQLRSVGLIAVLGLGVIATSALSGLASDGSGVLTGFLVHAGVVVISLLLNILLFWLGFRLATSREITRQQLLPAAVAAAVAWQILQFAGTYLLKHQLAHSSELYGGFALVLGLLGWLYLQAEITLYALEAAVVRHRRLWPRSLAAPLTPQDAEAFELYAKACQRRPGQHIESRIDIAPPAPQQSGS
jgi:membrane protein